MNKIWFTSDTHFGHANIIRYADRPFASASQMDKCLISNWNKCVRPSDTVYHLGDFALANYERIVEITAELNGSINLILGNHDRDVIRHRAQLVREGKFRSVQHYLELDIADTTICMNHYGQRVWNKCGYGSIHLYGHSHGKLAPSGRSVDVGVDSKEITRDYRPVSLEEVLAYMSTRNHVAYGPR